MNAEKAKDDSDSKRRIEHIRQAAKEAGLPEHIKLPSAVRLAQIAAGFGIYTDASHAIRRAVSLYLRARAFKSKHDNASVLDLARACDVELSKQLFRAAMMAPLKETCLLEPNKPTDKARRELAKCGLKLRKAKSVLENLRQLTRLYNMDSFIRKNKLSVNWTDGRPLWLWGVSTESDCEEQSRQYEALKAKCRLVTRKEYDERKEAVAKQNGWLEADAQAEWEQLLAGTREQRADGSLAYHLPSFWLGDLLKWKRSLKQSGGVKSRQAKKSSKSC